MKMEVALDSSKFDLAFIGLGVSNTFTLMNVLNRLLEQPPQKRVKILLIEKSDTHYTGVAYGPRSGQNSLIISTLEDFVEPGIRTEFIDWMRRNEATLLHEFRTTGGALSAQWIDLYRASSRLDIERERCVPRVFFGQFLREKVEAVIARAERAGVASIVSLTADVQDISVSGSHYAIHVGKGQRPLYSYKVILGIGPPEAGDLAYADGRRHDPVSHIVNNPYDEDIRSTCAARSAELCRKSPAKEINVLIVGSNASAIESTYLLFDQPGFLDAVNKVYVMSPSGRFPDRPVRNYVLPEFTPTHLGALKNVETLRAVDIYQAVQSDLDEWEARTAGTDLPVIALNAEIIPLVKRLSAEESAKFAATYGVWIGKRQRRAGNEYLDVADRLMQQGKVEHVAGRFDAIVSDEPGATRVSWVPAGEANAVEFEGDLSVIFNCMGPIPLWKQSNLLLCNLMRRGICAPNASGRGFVVGRNYECAANFHIAGPLISGNVIRDQPVWHVEHCGRLSSIAELLGEVLFRELREQTPLAA